MTTAHDFPDLSLSPIPGDATDSTEFLLEFSDSSGAHESFRAPRVVPTMDGRDLIPETDMSSHSSRLATRRSTNHSSSDLFIPRRRNTGGNRPDTVVEEDEQPSSDRLFHELEARVEKRLARTINNLSDFLDSGTLPVLSDVRVVVEMPLSEDTSSVLRMLTRMGATVLDELDCTLTHMIFSTGGRKELLDSVMWMDPRPHLVAPQWVHLCFSSGTRIPEENFSLFDGRRLCEYIRRTSELHELEGLHSANSTERNINGSRVEVFEDLTFDEPMSATQLLAKVEALSRRLDHCANGLPIRCPSRAVERMTSRAIQTDSPSRQRPRRRRSHGAFPLSHREPFSVAEEIRMDSRDTGYGDPPPPMNGRPLVQPGVVFGVDDMRRTVPADVNRIRQTLRNNLFYTRRGRVRVVPPSRPLPLPPLPPLPATPSRVLVPTRSSFLNRIQCVASSDEFVRRSQKKKRSVVLTSFTVREEREMLRIADSLQVTVEKNVDDDKLRCVVSADGARTMNTLKAIVYGVPIVTSQWMYDCQQENRLLETVSYEHEKWSRLLKLRRSTPRGIFSSVGRIRVIDGTSPPAPALKLLIRRTGGRITSNVLDASWIVAPRGFYAPPRPAGDTRLVISEKFILDCITENRILLDEDSEITEITTALDTQYLSDDDQ